MSVHNVRRGVPWLVLACFAGTVFGPVTAVASTRGRLNTAVGLTAASIYELARGHGGTALVMGAGSAYAWKRYKKSRKHHVYRYRYRSSTRYYRR